MNTDEKSIREQLDDLVQDKSPSNYVQYQHANTCQTPCLKCEEFYKRVFQYSQRQKVAQHLGCDCYYSIVSIKPLGSVSKKGLFGPDVWLKLFGKLPDYYITKEEAITKYGWNNSKNTLAGKAPGKMIGGDIYSNKERLLPEKTGRIWYECDIDYTSGKRSRARLYYSNDGLMFYSPDHLSGEVKIFQVK